MEDTEELPNDSYEDTSWISRIPSIGWWGSIASILGLFITIYIFKPASPIQLTVFVLDEFGNTPIENEGTLTIPIGNDLRSAEIGENGRVNFGEIPRKFYGEFVTIGIKVPGYVLIDRQNKFALNDNPIKLLIKRDGKLGLIKGNVIDQKTRSPLKDVMIRINKDTSVYTDFNGYFKLQLPRHMEVIESTEPYLVEAYLSGYGTDQKLYYPQTNDLEFRLEKSQ